jgi:hypothetical protein
MLGVRVGIILHPGLTAGIKTRRVSIGGEVLHTCDVGGAVGALAAVRSAPFVKWPLTSGIPFAVVSVTGCFVPPRESCHDADH